MVEAVVSIQEFVSGLTGCSEGFKAYLGKSLKHKHCHVCGRASLKYILKEDFLNRRGFCSRRCFMLEYLKGTN